MCGQCATNPRRLRRMVGEANGRIACRKNGRSYRRCFCRLHQLRVWKLPDFWTERLLAFLAEKQDFPPFEAAVKSVLPLLRNSDGLADHLRTFYVYMYGSVGTRSKSADLLENLKIFEETGFRQS